MKTASPSTKTTETQKSLIGIAVARKGPLCNDTAVQGLLQSIQQGIESLGGQAVVFSFEGIRSSADESSAPYRLPRRDLLADEVECVGLSSGVNGLVLVGSSSEAMAGLLMGTVRTSLPAILVNTGLPKEALSPSTTRNPGECPALRFALIGEALGVSLPGIAASIAESPERFELAYQTGRRAVEMAQQNLSLKKILGANALANAVRLDAALGGTADVTLHLLALAQECGVGLSYSAVEKIHQETPQMVDLRISGITEFVKAGGVLAVLSGLKAKLLPSSTVTGKSIMDLLRGISPKDPKVIHVKNPLRKSSGLAVLSGNLAPDGAIAHAGNFPPAKLVFAGPVKVFDSEERCAAAVRNRTVKKGMILVIRYEGPAGGPGMRPLRRVPAILEEMNLIESVPVITDGRFEGSPKGLFISMVSPEAAAGGAIALLKDGDQVEINVPQRQMIARLTDTDLRIRMARWKAPAPKASGGYLSRYSRLVTGAHLGAVVKS